MGIFRHSGNSITIDDFSMPLDFFISQEPTYSLPIGATWQQYEQGIEYYSSNGITQIFYDIPWADGDSYILNKSTYQSSYEIYLENEALPKTLPEAKTYQIGLLKTYWKTIRNGGAIYNSTTYPTDPIEKDHWVEEMQYSIRFGSSLGGHYVYDINRNKVYLTKVQLIELINLLDEFYWACRANYDTHTDAINSLATIQDVLDYDFTSGWPTVPYSI